MPSTQKDISLASSTACRLEPCARHALQGSSPSSSSSRKLCVTSGGLQRPDVCTCRCTAAAVQKVVLLIHFLHDCQVVTMVRIMSENTRPNLHPRTSRSCNSACLSPQAKEVTPARAAAAQVGLRGNNGVGRRCSPSQLVLRIHSLPVACRLQVNSVGMRSAAPAFNA